MLKARFSRVAIVACLAEKLPLQWRFGRHRQSARRVAALLQTVIRQMEPTLLTSPALARYPWCFLAPDSTDGERHYVVGAFLPPQSAADGPPEVLYTRVCESWLLTHLQSPVGLPLWLTRALVPLTNAGPRPLHSKKVRQACRLLQPLLVPERRVWRHEAPQAQARQLEDLYALRCDADEELPGEHGVDAMPWMDWPGCIQHNESIWLWRQSRHGKIIESQKVIIK